MAEADNVETVAAAIAEHLRMVKPSAERCADWIAPEGPLERIGNGWHYSAELGWTLVNAIRGGSVDGSRATHPTPPHSESAPPQPPRPTTQLGRRH